MLDPLEELFYNFAQWKGRRETWIYISDFSEKKIIQSNLVILAQKSYDALITLDLFSDFY